MNPELVIDRIESPEEFSRCHKFLNYCVANGMDRSQFYVLKSNSPTIEEELARCYEHQIRYVLTDLLPDTLLKGLGQDLVSYFERSFFYVPDDSGIRKGLLKRPKQAGQRLFIYDSYSRDDSEYNLKLCLPALLALEEVLVVDVAEQDDWEDAIKDGV